MFLRSANSPDKAVRSVIAMRMRCLSPFADVTFRHPLPGYRLICSPLLPHLLHCRSVALHEISYCTIRKPLFTQAIICPRSSYAACSYGVLCRGQCKVLIKRLPLVDNHILFSTSRYSSLFTVRNQQFRGFTIRGEILII